MELLSLAATFVPKQASPRKRSLFRARRAISGVKNQDGGYICSSWRSQCNACSQYSTNGHLPTGQNCSAIRPTVHQDIKSHRNWVPRVFILRRLLRPLRPVEDCAKLTIILLRIAALCTHESQEGAGVGRPLYYLWGQARTEMRNQHRIAPDQSAPRPAADSFGKLPWQRCLQIGDNSLTIGMPVVAQCHLGCTLVGHAGNAR